MPRIEEGPPCSEANGTVLSEGEGAKMRVLVIGGTGNISREIVRALLERGHEVTVYNRGRHRDPQPEGARVVHGDRKEREAFESTTRALAPEAVIDMISYSAEDAASAVRAFAGQVSHFIHCST